MITIPHICYDVNDLIDRRHEEEDLWEHEWDGSDYAPAEFDRLVEGGMPPDEAADWVDGCIEADRIARLGEERAETMALTMEINYGNRVPA